MNELSNELFLETAMLDFNHPKIQALIKQRRWQQLSHYHALGEIYNYVRDESFGYNADKRLSASQVMSDGYGQCNTKGALLRAVGIATGFHGFTIFNDLQRRFVNKNKSFSGYAISTKCLATPEIDWQGEDTYIPVTNQNALFSR